MREVSHPQCLTWYSPHTRARDLKREKFLVKQSSRVRPNKHDKNKNVKHMKTIQAGQVGGRYRLSGDYAKSKNTKL